MKTNPEILSNVSFLVGTVENILEHDDVSAREPFDDEVVEFLNDLSREIMKDSRGKKYSDVVTFGFWIRKSSVLDLKKRFVDSDRNIRLGKGIVFHIAPSNVPVNFAYSLVSGLICGNANIVRVPSKDFVQVAIIADAFNKVLDKYQDLNPYVTCVRYDHDKDVNDLLSSIADMRVIWGGDQTIQELRKSPLSPRSGEITFADRYSIAVIDSDFYFSLEDKERVAEDFYNDTFLSDQNACTSPRLVAWTGNSINEAQKIFWEKEYELVKKKYAFQDIQGVNKLTQGYLVAVGHDVKILEHSDNLIVRVKVDRLTEDIMNYKSNCGYFYEYDCQDIVELVSVCKDKRCQTIGYIGDSDEIISLLKIGIKGVDRVVPIGKTMDFDLVWDGYDLISELTRKIGIM